MDCGCDLHETAQGELCVVWLCDNMERFLYAALEPGAALLNTASPADLSPSTCF